MTTYYYDDLSNVKKMCQTFSLLFRQVVAAVILIFNVIRPSVCLSVLLSMYSPDDEVMIYSPLFPSLLVCVQLQQHYRN